MPWRERSPVDERLQLAQEYESGLFSMTELAAQYGVSRKTGYEWVERYRTEGVGGMVDRSRRPHTSPQATDPALVKAIVAQRKRHPRWGATKLLAVLHREQPKTMWPARSTVCDLLKARGLVETRRRARRLAPTSSSLVRSITRANEVWTTDFKGEFRTGDGVYCYPLTLRDGFSRYVLRCDGLLATAYAGTRRRFERAFAEYGLPERIRSDNGGPFAAPGVGRLSRLSVWWMRLGIVPERIALGHPEQNGSHEQFHSVLKAETARPPAPNLRAQQQRFRRFVREYNDERPHEALQNQSPTMCYHPSARPFPTRLPALEYAGHLEIRRVSSTGSIKWGGDPVFVSEVLAGQDVALEEVDDALWTLYFAATPLARFDVRAKMLRSLR
jgi:putative transposase